MRAKPLHQRLGKRLEMVRLHCWVLSAQRQELQNHIDFYNSRGGNYTLRKALEEAINLWNGEQRQVRAKYGTRGDGHAD